MTSFLEARIARLQELTAMAGVQTFEIIVQRALIMKVHEELQKLAKSVHLAANAHITWTKAFKHPDWISYKKMDWRGTDFDAQAARCFGGPRAPRAREAFLVECADIVTSQTKFHAHLGTYGRVMALKVYNEAIRIYNNLEERYLAARPELRTSGAGLCWYFEQPGFLDGFVEHYAQLRDAREGALRHEAGLPPPSSRNRRPGHVDAEDDDEDDDARGSASDDAEAEDDDEDDEDYEEPSGPGRKRRRGASRESQPADARPRADAAGAPWRLRRRLVSDGDILALGAVVALGCFAVVG